MTAEPPKRMADLYFAIRETPLGSRRGGKGSRLVTPPDLLFRRQAVRLCTTPFSSRQRMVCPVVTGGFEADRERL